VVSYLFGLKYKESKVLWFCFVMNTLMGIIFLFNVSGGRYGIDYIAYLQQAAAVWNGETNYVKLSSNLGPCFYPAGHIWHYIPAVWLHLATEHAETIIKFGHLLIHSLINLFVGKIAYMYFKEDSTKVARGFSNPNGSSEAQLLVISMLCSKEAR